MHSPLNRHKVSGHTLNLATDVLPDLLLKSLASSPTDVKKLSDALASFRKQIADRTPEAKSSAAQGFINLLAVHRAAIEALKLEDISDPHRRELREISKHSDDLLIPHAKLTKEPRSPGQHDFAMEVRSIQVLIERTSRKQFRLACEDLAAKALAIEDALRKNRLNSTQVGSLFTAINLMWMALSSAETKAKDSGYNRWGNLKDGDIAGLRETLGRKMSERTPADTFVSESMPTGHRAKKISAPKR